jgi:hypothetical protein
MIRFACIFVALGLAATGSTALAAKPGPVLMTDAQMDNVTAGFITIVFQDSFNNWIVDFGNGGQAVNGPGGSSGPGGGSGGSSGPSSGNGPVFLFALNIAAIVNAAIANGGGDATATQSIGTVTQGLHFTAFGRR